MTCLIPVVEISGSLPLSGLGLIYIMGLILKSSIQPRLWALILSYARGKNPKSLKPETLKRIPGHSAADDGHEAGARSCRSLGPLGQC